MSGPEFHELDAAAREALDPQDRCEPVTPTGRRRLNPCPECGSFAHGDCGDWLRKPERDAMRRRALWGDK